MRTFMFLAMLAIGILGLTDVAAQPPAGQPQKVPDLTIQPVRGIWVQVNTVDAVVPEGIAAGVWFYNDRSVDQYRRMIDEANRSGKQRPVMQTWSHAPGLLKVGKMQLLPSMSPKQLKDKGFDRVPVILAGIEPDKPLLVVVGWDPNEEVTFVGKKVRLEDVMKHQLTKMLLEPDPGNITLFEHKTGKKEEPKQKTPPTKN